jgi:hypothetical protein
MAVKKKEEFTLAKMCGKQQPNIQSPEEIRANQQKKDDLEKWRAFQRKCPEHRWVS